MQPRLSLVVTGCGPALNTILMRRALGAVLPLIGIRTPASLARPAGVDRHGRCGDRGGSAGCGGDAGCANHGPGIQQVAAGKVQASDLLCSPRVCGALQQEQMQRPHIGMPLKNFSWQAVRARAGRCGCGGSALPLAGVV